MVEVVVASTVGVDPVVPGIGSPRKDRSHRVLAVSAFVRDRVFGVGRHHAFCSGDDVAISVLVIVVVSSAVGVDPVVPGVLGCGVHRRHGVIAVSAFEGSGVLDSLGRQSDVLVGDEAIEVLVVVVVLGTVAVDSVVPGVVGAWVDRLVLVVAVLVSGEAVSVVVHGSPAGLQVGVGDPGACGEGGQAEEERKGGAHAGSRRPQGAPA